MQLSFGWRIKAKVREEEELQQQRHHSEQQNKSGERD
jgi:hypothetical protein